MHTLRCWITAENLELIHTKNLFRKEGANNHQWMGGHCSIDDPRLYWKAHSLELGAKYLEFLTHQLVGNVVDYHGVNG